MPATKTSCVALETARGMAPERARRFCGELGDCVGHYVRRKFSTPQPTSVDRTPLGVDFNALGDAGYLCADRGDGHGVMVVGGRVVTHAPHAALDETVRAAVSDRTHLSVEPCHGQQVSYHAPSGTVLLWYPANDRVIAGRWSVEARPAGSPLLCYDYGPNSWNPVLRERGRKRCMPFSQHVMRLPDSVAGNPFGLSEGAPVPARLGGAEGPYPPAFARAYDPLHGHGCAQMRELDAMIGLLNRSEDQWGAHRAASRAPVRAPSDQRSTPAPRKEITR
ncbi:MAG: hypothetical protein ACFBWO_16300 [Paracoccaceae bacterium]